MVIKTGMLPFGSVRVYWKRETGTYRGDRYVLYLSRGVGHTDIHLSKSRELYLSNMLSLLYVNYISITYACVCAYQYSLSYTNTHTCKRVISLVKFYLLYRFLFTSAMLGIKLSASICKSKFLC
jgi:hypothetical protein